MKKLVLGSVLCLSLTFTAACESSEERAEKHFQDGVALLEAGDVDRALVELRNVFRLDGTHKEARRIYARAEIERGNVSAGYSQYLRLVEQYPDDVDARRELTRMAMENGQWDEVAKHSPFLLQADANDPLGRLADIGLRYRTALEADDAGAQEELATEALALREVLPDNAMIPELLADHFIKVGKREEALEEIDRAIGLAADPRRLYTMRLALLNEMGDLDGVEAGLREMVEKFPDDPEVQATLVRWLLSQNKVDDAEEYLRNRAGAGGSAEKIDLVRFLVQFQGREAAVAELDALTQSDAANINIYRTVRAGLMFDDGRREEAIAELQSIVDAATEETDETRNVRIALAQMLEATGNSVGARSLVENVLASDANHVEALKMRAAWLIDGDEADDAILTLRTALEQSPRDPALMTLMAQAYERSGNRALMAEMLSLAVEVSNGAPTETIRYARYLIGDGKTDIAERTLVDSLRLNPGNFDLLGMLGSIYVEQSDWARANQVADTLAGLDAEAATGAANALRAQVLAGQGRTDEVIGLLEGLAESGEAGFGVHLAIVRTRIAANETEDAMRYVDEHLARAPDDPNLRFLKAAILEVEDKGSEAEAIYRELANENPQAILVWRALYLLQQRQSRPDDAAATLEAALEANPDVGDLLWIKASQLQVAGDLEGALDIYADMYERDSSSPIIANNYASLLTMLRDDQASIDRAYSVARRLQSVQVPAFQDTYGWIAYLRDEYEEAIQYLEPAAAALTGDPSVQYHLGLAYAASGRVDDAKAALERTIDLVDGGAALPQVEEARQKLAELERPGE